MSPRGGARKGSGREKKNRTEAITVRGPAKLVAETKQAARFVKMSLTDYVLFVVAKENSEVRKMMPMDQKTRERKIRALEKKMFALLDAGDADGAQVYDDQIAELDGSYDE